MVHLSSAVRGSSGRARRHRRWRSPAPAGCCSGNRTPVGRRGSHNGLMSYQHLLVKRDDDIVTITLNRPEKRNALALPVLRELTAAFAEVGGSDARGVILAANGPVFSAGHSFAELAGTTVDDARA